MVLTTRLLACFELVCDVIRFYALRRRDPTAQPLLRTVPYQLPPRAYED